MFNYRLDKVGFFATLILAAVAVATVLTTVVLLVAGNWESVEAWVKFTLGLGWVLCVGTVLVRVYTYHYQRQKMLRERQQQAAAMQGHEGTDGQADNGQGDRNGAGTTPSVESHQRSGESA